MFYLMIFKCFDPLMKNIFMYDFHLVVHMIRNKDNKRNL